MQGIFEAKKRKDLLIISIRMMITKKARRYGQKYP